MTQAAQPVWYLINQNQFYWSGMNLTPVFPFISMYILRNIIIINYLSLSSFSFVHQWACGLESQGSCTNWCTGTQCRWSFFPVIHTPSQWHLWENMEKQCNWEETSGDQNLENNSSAGCGRWKEMDLYEAVFPAPSTEKCKQKWWTTKEEKGLSEVFHVTAVNQS